MLNTKIEANKEQKPTLTAAPRHEAKETDLVNSKPPLSLPLLPPLPSIPKTSNLLRTYLH